MRKSILTMVTVAGMLSVPAQAGCWAAQDAAAARVRDLQSMLMVAALRCRIGGNDLLTHYNDFVRDNKSAIQAMNDRLKARFHREHGAVEGQRHYDRFTTALANAYGAGGSGNCDDMGVLAREARMQAGSIDGLVLIADRTGVSPVLPGGHCPIVMAAK